MGVYRRGRVHRILAVPAAPPVVQHVRRAFVLFEHDDVISSKTFLWSEYERMTARALVRSVGYEIFGSVFCEVTGDSYSADILVKDLPSVEKLMLNVVGSGMLFHIVLPRDTSISDEGLPVYSGGD